MLALLLVVVPPSLPAQELETVPIRRSLEGFSLGDRFGKVKKLIPPAKIWEGLRDRARGVVFFRLTPELTESFPKQVRELGLGFKGGRLRRKGRRLKYRGGKLAFLKVIYDSKRTKETPLSELVVALSMDYGPPQSEGTVYMWKDKKTVLRAFLEEVPVKEKPGKKKKRRPSRKRRRAKVELLVSLQVMNADLYPPRYQSLVE